MRAHLVQFDIAWEDKLANYAAVDRLLAGSGVLGGTEGDLIVLPEMFDTGFSTNVAQTADTDQKTLAYLRTLARRTGSIVHGARTLRAPDGRGINVATVVDAKGGVICEYTKHHLFPLGAAPEAERFVRGQEIRTYTWTRGGGGSVAPSKRPEDDTLIVCPTICYDLRFPELFLLGLKAGAGLFTVTSSWPSPREGHRRTLSIARAIENQAYVLSVNRCGRDPQLEYSGGTIAIDPRGEVLGELGTAEGVLSVDVDPREVRRWREVFPPWRERVGG